ncbi:uncharacterized protein LOC110733214 [Chenopodium quinoa]|uniref:uncharacterized protein LOC110733214 n=1 Tax=Chenopodium quinoa TaxID=63459 RepID=UPI000B794B33|nr:uncharacterized protein LOC110733214 [Chenopodium quinoa]
MTTPAQDHLVNFDDGWRLVGKKTKTQNIRQTQHVVTRVNAYNALMDDEEAANPIGGDGSKVKLHKFDFVKKKFGKAWEWICNYSFFPKGIIWVGWKPDAVSLDVIAVNEQFMHTVISAKDFQHQIACTFVYGLHSIQDRLNGNPVTDYEVKDFQNFVHYLELVEIKSKVDLVHSAAGKGKSFRFLNCLTSHKDFQEVVSSHWNVNVTGNSMLQVWKKLKFFKTGLKDPNNNNFTKITDRQEAARSHLAEVQTQLAEEFTNVSLQTQEAAGIEKNRNRIDSIYNSDDVMLKDPDLFQAEIISFYKNLLGSAASTLPTVDVAIVRAGKQLFFDDIDILSAPISHAEIYQALANIGDDKAPGIDGFNAVFFKQAWNHVKSDVYKAILDFFDTGVLEKSWSCTTFTLVPKVQNPSYVKEYRPISCCTLVYKLISKVITARVARVVGSVVNDAQAGFIPGKHIGDNIFLATELIKGYSHKFVIPRCMLKNDLRKAYDSVEWGFLEVMLGELGFPNKVITWIMGCITSVSYSVMINGYPSAPFQAKKGLRQGDPMSPFLFALCMEYLSRCLQNMTKNPDFNFHPRCERLGITHLMFADDLVLFSRADLVYVKLLFKAFQQFSEAFGLSANLDKSDAYFGGILDHERCELHQIFILPKKIIRDMESRFRYFLWNGEGYPTKKALVAWKQDFWTAPIPNKASWILKKIFASRDNVIVNGKMQIKKLYSIIKPHGPKVPWKRITCNNQASPKSIFVTWLAILDRLLLKGDLRNDLMFTENFKSASELIREITFLVACRCNSIDRYLLYSA